MRVAICDDEPAFVQEMTKMIRQCGFFHDSWQISTFTSGEELLFPYEDHRHPFDIILLDIRMEGIDGLSAGLSVRRKDTSAIILYLTAYSQFSLAAYEVFPLYYMVKPVSRQRFLDVFSKALAMSEKKRQESVYIRSRETERFLPIHEIIYMESYQHNILIHTTQGEEVPCSGTLRALLEQIDKSYFYRIHRSYAVNLYETAGFSSARRRLTMKDQTELPVSRQHVRELARKFIEVHTHVEHL